MIALDASVLIAWLDGADRHHARAEQLLADQIAEDFATNPLTLAEVLDAPAREDRLEEALTALGDLEVRELPWPDDTAVALAGLRAATGPLPDCCVLLAAERSRGRIATFDARLLAAAAGRRLGTVDGQP